MSVLNEALQVLGLAPGAARYCGPAPCASRPRQEQRELAATMRALPGRFADRLSASALERITGAAAAGRWEEAVDELITALHTRAEAVTDQERDELRAVLEARCTSPAHPGADLRDRARRHEPPSDHGDTDQHLHAVMPGTGGYPTLQMLDSDHRAITPQTVEHADVENENRVGRGVGRHRGHDGGADHGRNTARCRHRASLFVRADDVGANGEAA